MNAILGATALAGGLLLIVHGLAVLTNFRGAATRYWGALYEWHDRNDPFWRSRGVRVFRSFGASIELAIGFGLISVGVLWVSGSVA
jgi:hypothetical protein